MQAVQIWHAMSSVLQSSIRARRLPEVHSSIANSERPAFPSEISFNSIAKDQRVDECTADKVRMAGMGHQGKRSAELTRYSV